ncbi:hypothetical protein DKX38_015284 [Salix brachista]|uniref:Uncharacterized protein n=1 Tax=Salix brachista TaxID=2182728 RepID=A0A5N5L6L7_9ROSI|nr:hypothetical protein DKX38_015284 [Salix brachista]
MQQFQARFLVDLGNYLVHFFLLDLSDDQFGGEIPSSLEFRSSAWVDFSSNFSEGSLPIWILQTSLFPIVRTCQAIISREKSRKRINRTYLGALNLSWKQLTGKILTRLEVYNGPIPSSNRFQTFNDPSTYEGNSQLCRSPIPTSCSSPEFKDGEVEDGDDGEMQWFYLGMDAGFSVGFWVVCGTLIMKKSWRRAYFQFVDKTKDKIFVAIAAVNVSRLRRWSTR